MSKYNMKGWDWKKWLLGNKDKLKVFVGAGVALAVWYQTANPGAVGAALSAGAGLVASAVTDVIDYWQSA